MTTALHAQCQQRQTQMSVLQSKKILQEGGREGGRRPRMTSECAATSKHSQSSALAEAEAADEDDEEAKRGRDPEHLVRHVPLRSHGDTHDHTHRLGKGRYRQHNNQRERMNEQTGERAGGWMDGWMDGWWVGASQNTITHAQHTQTNTADDTLTH